ncbi:MAG: hypothetical protein AB1489_32785 [Acidobacteriota bacterium]
MNIKEEQVISYILGELSEEEQIVLEEQYFSNEDVFEQALAIEDELIDAYVKDKLPEHLQKRFSTRFVANSIYKDRIEIAKIINRHLATPKQQSETLKPKVQLNLSWREALAQQWRQFSSLRTLMAFAIILIVGCGGIWLYSKNLQLKSQLQQLQTKETILEKQLTEQQEQLSDLTVRLEKLQNQQSKSISKPEKQSLSENLPLVFALSSLSMRDSNSTKQLIIPSQSVTIQFQLYSSNLNKYESFLAQFRTAEGKEICHQNISRVKNDRLKYLAVNLHKNLFIDENYIIKLTGITRDGKFEEIEDYSFYVKRQ